MANPLALAIDFKKFTPNILSTGEYLLTHVYRDSKLVLFHIIEYFFTPPAYLLPYLNIEKERLEKELEGLARPLKAKGLTVEKTVILGEFWHALQHFVEILNPEMIILGYEPHLLKVPTAEKILERIEVTYLVVKENPLNQVKNILCPFDFSDMAKRALKKALEFSYITGSEIKVLYVISPLESPDKTCNLKFVSEREREVQKDWEIFLKEESLLQKGLSLEIICGHRIEEILKKAKEYEADLIIMGRRGKILKFGLGSISKAIIKNFANPVLLVA